MILTRPSATLYSSNPRNSFTSVNGGCHGLKDTHPERQKPHHGSTVRFRSSNPRRPVRAHAKDARCCRACLDADGIPRTRSDAASRTDQITPRCRVYRGSPPGVGSGNRIFHHFHRVPTDHRCYCLPVRQVAPIAPWVAAAIDQRLQHRLRRRLGIAKRSIAAAVVDEMKSVLLKLVGICERGLL